MSHHNHPPPPPLPFMPPPYHTGNVGSFWPRSSLNSENVEPQPQFEYAPPFKRPRNYDNHPPNSAPFPPMNPRMSQPSPTVTKGTINIFFKTRMCAKFLDGNCRNGKNCTFAHGVEDMREPPPNWQEIIRVKDMEVGNWNDDQRIIHRMKICRKFYNGAECPYGEKCNFIHENPSKFKTDIIRPLPRESSAISIGTMGQVMEHRSDTDQAELNKHINASLDSFRSSTKPWKTTICSKWEIKGQCPFGDRCHFAHGHAELQLAGGHIEADVTTNIGSILIKKAFPTKMEVGVPTHTEEAGNNNGVLKWKLHRKIKFHLW